MPRHPISDVHERVNEIPIHWFVYHESEHEDRKGSDTLVVRFALNDGVE